MGNTVRRKTWSLAAAFILAAGLAVLGMVGVSASAATLPSAAAIARGWSSVPEYASAPALASGVAVTANGRPAANATVILYPVTLTPKAGTTLTPLARTSTDAHGDFTVRLPAARLGQLSAPWSAGALNLHVVVFSAGGIAQHFYAIPRTSARALASGRAAATGPSAPATLVLHAGSRSRPASAVISPDTCAVDGSPSTITGLPVVVGMKESDAGDLADTKFTYTSSASLTLGTGVSYTNGSVGFSQAGTTVKTASGSYTWDNLPSKSNNLLEASGQYTDQGFLCLTAGNYSHYWTMIQHYVGGQLATPGITPIDAGDCIPLAPHSAETWSSGTQQTFSTGVKISVKGLGADLSSQGGYSSSVTLTYKMGNNGHPACGVGAPPGAKLGNIGVIQIHSSITS